MLLMQAQENRVVLDEEKLLFIAGKQTNMFDDDVDKAPVQDLALSEDNVFQADQCDAFDSDVDEAPTTHTMFMVNLLSANLIYDEAGPSYDLDILSDIQDHDNYLDSVDKYQESALYNGHEIVKTTRAPAVVHDLGDTLETPEKTRKKMLKKMKSPLCVENRVKIASPDYSKENYLATFIPHRLLTLEQIFWSSDILILKPISKMTVVMNAVNTIFRFSEIRDAYTVEQARCLELEATNSLLTENDKLKAQLKGKMKCVTLDTIKLKVLAPGMYAIDVEPILPRNMNNREVHLDYLKHLKESVETLREIVEGARIEKPLDIHLKMLGFTQSDLKNC
uniref:Retrovirus-related Pol polyprotein from transposon TNT 1-94 n=1 Tax=Tanacetum cinerariifolium TaxID=118510 RepID=A0A6L2JV43_TANCI|nr:retrovirus-related Pol polyprotein from transposon TNT 1-94 [Tanacetum cinerariifolium]